MADQDESIYYVDETMSIVTEQKEDQFPKDEVTPQIVGAHFETMFSNETRVADQATAARRQHQQTPTANLPRFPRPTESAATKPPPQLKDDMGSSEEALAPHDHMIDQNNENSNNNDWIYIYGKGAPSLTKARCNVRLLVNDRYGQFDAAPAQSDKRRAIVDEIIHIVTQQKRGQFLKRQANGTLLEVEPRIVRAHLQTMFSDKTRGAARRQHRQSLTAALSGVGGPTSAQELSASAKPPAQLKDDTMASEETLELQEEAAAVNLGISGGSTGTKDCQAIAHQPPPEAHGINELQYQHDGSEPHCVFDCLRGSIPPTPDPVPALASISGCSSTTKGALSSSSTASGLDQYHGSRRPPDKAPPPEDPIQGAPTQAFYPPTPPAQTQHSPGKAPPTQKANQSALSFLPPQLPLRNCRIASTQIRLQFHRSRSGAKSFVAELKFICNSCGQDFHVDEYVNVIECRRCIPENGS